MWSIVATTAQTLKVQIEYKLKGVRYSCDKYDLTTATICHLKTHIKNKHEGVRYPCDLFDYAATTNTALKIQVEAMQAHSCKIPLWFMRVFRNYSWSVLKKHTRSKHL